LVCQDFTIEIGPDGTATLDPSDVIASNDDACGIFTTAVDITEFSCADIGTTVTVQVFSQDNNGNLSSCFATVTAVDVLAPVVTCPADQTVDPGAGNLDRKSTRLNSSHVKISYAVFCLKKKTYRNQRLCLHS